MVWNSKINFLLYNFQAQTKFSSIDSVYTQLVANQAQKVIH